MIKPDKKTKVSSIQIDTSSYKTKGITDEQSLTAPLWALSIDALPPAQ